METLRGRARSGCNETQQDNFQYIISYNFTAKLESEQNERKYNAKQTHKQSTIIP